MLPNSFAIRVGNLVHCLDQYDSATMDEEKDRLLREALAIACNLLTSVNEKELRFQLNKILNPDNIRDRHDAATILKRDDLFNFFLIMEDELLRRALLLEPVLNFSQIRFEASGLRRPASGSQPKWN